MRFQVPQFTDVEDKIIGPFTLKQFIYLGGAAGICLLLYSFLPLFIAIFLMIPIAGLGVALAFYKVHNRPFIKIMEASFRYITGGRLYVWKHRPKKIERGAEKENQNKKSTEALVPKLTQSKLKDLTWSLDIKESSTEPPKEADSTRPTAHN